MGSFPGHVAIDNVGFYHTPYNSGIDINNYFPQPELHIPLYHMLQMFQNFFHPFPYAFYAILSRHKIIPHILFPPHVNRL